MDGTGFLRHLLHLIVRIGVSLLRPFLFHRVYQQECREILINQESARFALERVLKAVSVGRVADVGPIGLHTHIGVGAQANIQLILAEAGNRRHRGSTVMAGDGHNLHPYGASLILNGRMHRSQHPSGRLRRHKKPGWNSQRLTELCGPALLAVIEQAGRPGDGCFRRSLDAGIKVTEQVGEHDQLIRIIHARVVGGRPGKHLGQHITPVAQAACQAKRLLLRNFRKQLL